MKVAVCLKQTLSRESQIRPDEKGTWVREGDGSWELNEPDGFALEAALRIKDAHGAEVIVVSAGPDRVSSVLREALARGADRAIHVTDESPAADIDPQAVAHALAAALKDEQPDLVLTGLQSDDHGFGQVGVALAEALGFCHATIVVDIDILPDGVRVKRELEGGRFQRLSLRLPAVLTVQSGINRLRYVTLRGVMAAKKKDIRRIQAPASAARQRIVAIRIPDRQRRTHFVGGSPSEASEELVRLLKSAGAI